MSELKTKETSKSVKAFLDAITNENRRSDCFEVLALMQEVTQERPKMWGDSIVGFGSYHYRYASGREGDWFITGFSPRKQNLTLYITPGFSRYETLMQVLGKYKTGKSCLYVKKLDDIDRKTLKQLLKRSVQDMLEIYQCSKRLS